MTQKLKAVIIQLKKTLDLYSGFLVVEDVISFSDLNSKTIYQN